MEQEYQKIVICFMTQMRIPRLKITHRLKQSFSPLFIEAIESHNLQQIARYGLMINGITSIYFPDNFRLNVNVGDELKASESLIGYFS